MGPVIRPTYDLLNVGDSASSDEIMYAFILRFFLLIELFVTMGQHKAMKVNSTLAGKVVV